MKLLLIPVAALTLAALIILHCARWGELGAA